MIKNCIKGAYCFYQLPILIRYKCSTKKISNIIEELSEKLTQKQLFKKDVEQNVLKNYMQLTEESYLEHLLAQQKFAAQKLNKIDPHIILMILPTLEKQETIRQHLLMLYPHLPLFNSKELILFFQYLLAHKLTIKPKIPAPKPLLNNQALLVLLGEIYPKDMLIDWLKSVPLYDGNNLYLIAMGTFSIVSGLSENVKLKNQQVIDRCFKRIRQLFQAEQSELRLGVILLGLQMRLAFSEELLLIDYSLDLQQIDGIKRSLLLIELDKYLKLKFEDVQAHDPSAIQAEEIEINRGINQYQPIKQKQPIKYVYDASNREQIKFKLEQQMIKIIRSLMYDDWKVTIKLHVLVKFYTVLKGKKLQADWLMFSQRLMNFTVKKQQLSVFTNLTTSELLEILQCFESHKINKPNLLKNLLVLISDRLEEASKEELIRLTRILVTYVRQCQDYLIHVRQIILRRKFIFNMQDIERLNQIFKRVQVLFPKPLNY